MQRDRFDSLVCIQLARKICEHSAIAGATVDAIVYLAHIEIFIVILSCKVSLVFGAIGVVLLHKEEAKRWKRAHTLTKEVANV